MTFSFWAVIAGQDSATDNHKESPNSLRQSIRGKKRGGGLQAQSRRYLPCIREPSVTELIQEQEKDQQWLTLHSNWETLNGTTLHELLVNG
ncbi:hypothetical protein P7K49_006314 [Saguinus oedipus]|uniref:Uncharacterized protein n=1 Tax=Saguinus oedipus TaxID=9490 RepID=A0ABQ9W4G9_SAGOE|nr:hypothetical protein P7K49_006314 [Saguinus oedipus]